MSFGILPQVANAVLQAIGNRDIIVLYYASEIRGQPRRYAHQRNQLIRALPRQFRMGVPAQVVLERPFDRVAHQVVVLAVGAGAARFNQRESLVDQRVPYSVNFSPSL